MKILEVRTLALEPIKMIRFARFRDHRGYFTEHFRQSDLWNHSQATGLKNVLFVQGNESYSRRGTLRGLHFQWNPYMGKLVRTVSGRMLDIVLDIRKGSPTWGQAILQDMPANRAAEFDEWIWVPPGFAHGNVFLEDTLIEYLCSGEYSQGCEAGISPYSQDIDWSLCDPALKASLNEIASTTTLVTDKDRNGFSLKQWLADARSDNFTMQTVG
jgi:dTDP-4-dehydrorhamnose 3,5-epimerase